ncbi:Multidrug resistance-associated protein 4 [Clydaea vesicula]|uniref:Multidrug resistance-associated protein 4 n=1 Tax=Clydaea vesicula TaxID=447962 RepID=A0AAD5U412_9FUNG|nr:Multidrug resistance-associated protein 4 [Clydaea vesicula]
MNKKKSDKAIQEIDLKKEEDESQFFKKQKYKAKKREDFTKASQFSFQYLNDLLKNGLKTKLDIDSFPEIDSFNMSNKLSGGIMKSWIKQKSDNKRKPSLLKAFLKVFGSDFYKASVCLLLETLLRIGQALIITLFLNFFSHPYNGSETTYAIGLGMALIITQVVIVTVHNVGFYILSKLGMQVRVSIIATIYEKLLSLNVSNTSSTGLIVNLMSNDVQRFEELCQVLCYLFIGPIELLLSVYFIYAQISYAAFVAVGLLFLLLPIQSFFSRIFTKLRGILVKFQDERVSSLSDMFSGIMIVKLYTWELPFCKQIQASREDEVRYLKKSAFAKSLNEAIFHSSSTLIASITFLSFFFLNGSLSPAQVFSTLTLLSNIRLSMTRFFPRCIQLGSECLISLRRIEDFLLLDDQTEKTVLISESTSTEKKIVQDLDEASDSNTESTFCNLKNASFNWKLNSFGKTVDEEDTIEILHNININIKSGNLYGVCGPVGCGKSSFAAALLGEMECKSGSFFRRKSIGNRKLKIAYSSQSAWIFSGSIRDNICYGSEFNQKWFDEVIKACAMEKDVYHFPDGVNTIVGGRGVTLSGGQRARIALARSVYSDADLYVLDDPLSAVDTKVGRHIFESCIQKLLMNVKYEGNYRRSPAAVVLITHQLQYIQLCDKVLVLNEGNVEAVGTFNQVIATSDKESSFTKKMKEFLDTEVEPEEPLLEDKSVDQITIASTLAASDDAIGRSELTIEDSSVGHVSLSTYLSFLTSGSSTILALLLLLYLVFGQFTVVFSSYWLSVWTNQNKVQQEQNYFYNVFILSGMVVLCLFINFTGAAAFFAVCLNSSKLMFDKMLSSVTRSPMDFFHQNPHGRLMNRFSKDINIVDEILPACFFDTLQLFLVLLGIFVMTAVIIPAILIIFPFLAGSLFYVRKYYINTSRQLRRYEAITRSPIYSEVPATLEGLSTIRAFATQKKSLFNFHKLLDYNTTMNFTFICITKWLSVRMDAVATLFLVVVVFSSILLKIYSNLSPGFCGLILTYSMQLVGLIQFAVRQSTEVENYMISAERVMEYTILPSEAAEVTELKPPENWPTQGNIRVHDYNLKYKGSDRKILDNISVDIAPGEKIGIVGRTGAGKSSFLQGLFRIVEPESGYIEIDDINTSLLGLKDLRSKISIIPQEPFCFKGTIRFNLDPFAVYSDEEIWKALDSVELKRAIEALPNKMESSVSEGGSNFSVGERQLICLARAILRNSRLIVMDEATSSIDLHTDSLIQNAIRTEFKHSTVLTIAHRLNTVIDYDKIIVLDYGKLVEFGSPAELLSKDSSSSDAWFKKMVEEMGEDAANTLIKIAFEKS